MSPRARGRWIPTTFTVLVLGLLSVGLLFLARWLDHEMIRRDEVALAAVERARLDLATAHLWLEEYVTGDAIEAEEIRAPLARAAAGLSGVLGDTRDGARRSPLRDPLLAAQAREIFEQIAELRSLAEARLTGQARGRDVGVGSASDVAYDVRFKQIFEQTGELAAALEQGLSASRERSWWLFRIVVMIWIAIVLLAVLSLGSLEKRRRTTEHALVESREQLLQSQKLEAVGQLAGGLAHDINNYLGAIRGHTDLADLKLDAASSARPHLQGILRVVEKASGLIDRLLAFTRQQPARPRVLDLNRIVREGMGSVLHGLIGDAVVLESRLEAGLWPVELDPAQLEQVLMNLVVNARDAMPGGGTLTVRTANVSIGPDHPWRASAPRAGDYVLLAISDTGEGIPDAIRSKIFEPFFTTKERAGSSGLGLATVLGIVGAGGGGLHLDSAPGRGSTFTVLLPRSERQLVEAAPAPAPRAARAPARRVQSILLVEDNHDMRQAAVEMLCSAGYRVSAAADPEAALRLCDSEPGAFELVISDLVMPGMSGTRLVELLTARQPDLSVLFVTGHTDEVVLRHGLGEQVAPLLRKPFSMDELLDAIDELALSERPAS